MKKHGLLYFSIILLLFICGCGNKSQEELGVNNILSSEISFWEMSLMDDMKEPAEGYLVETDFQKRMDDAQILKRLNLPDKASRIAGHHAQHEGNTYVLDTFLDQDNIYYVLSDFSEKSLPKVLDLEQKIQGMGYIQCMISGKEGELLLGILAEYSQTEEEYKSYYIAGISVEGEYLWSREISNMLMENGAEGAMDIGTLLACDSNDNIYIHSPGNNRVYIVNFGQDEILSYDVAYPTETAQIDEMMIDGQAVFYTLSNEKNVFWGLKTEGIYEKTISIWAPNQIRKWYGMENTTIYYATSEDLISWDVKTGVKQKIVNFSASGINSLPMELYLNDGKVELVFRDQDRYAKMAFGEEEPRIDATITVANLNKANNILKGGTKIFDREHKNITLNYQDYSKNDDVDRILMEVMSGKGPDVLLVSQETFRALQQQGALAQWEDYLTEDILANLLPGAIQLGTVNDKIYGLPLFIEGIDTVVTNKQFWETVGWTPTDVLGVLEKHTDLQGIFLDYFGMESPEFNMYVWIGRSLGKSEFLQKSNGFKSEAFGTILRQIKEKTHSGMQEDGFECVSQGKYLGCQMHIAGVLNFSTVYKRAGADSLCVGYPSDDKQGNYMNADGGIVVINQASMQKAGIEELVHYLFGLEYQMTTDVEYKSISVRQDVPGAKLAKGTDMVIKIDGRDEDGSTYLNEYIDFLRSASPLPVNSEIVFRVLEEEAGSFFSSDKKLDSVIEIIQNRIHLMQEEGSIIW